MEQSCDMFDVMVVTSHQCLIIKEMSLSWTGSCYRSAFRSNELNHKNKEKIKALQELVAWAS